MTSPPTSLILSIPEIADRGALCEPITVGVPLPSGAVRDPGRIALEDDAGHVVPLQVRTTEQWPDGSLRWVLLDFQLTGAWQAQRRFLLHPDSQESAPVSPAIVIEEARRQITVDTGAARFVVKTGEAYPFAHVNVDGKEVLDADGGGLIATTPAGRLFTARTTSVAVEERGPIRTTLCLTGTIGPSRHPPIHVTTRLRFFAGSSAVRLSLTVHNPRRARHQGGIWELGDTGSRYLRDLSLQLATAGAITHLEFSCECDDPIKTARLPIELYQDSSGGDNWRHQGHVDRHGEIACAFRGYRCESPEGRIDGLRATPVMVARHAGGITGLATEYFWQNFPKGVSVEPGRLIWRFFPGQISNEHELQGGEQKTHSCTLVFGSDGSARDALFWGRGSTLARMTPAWYCASQAMADLTPVGTDRYQQLVDCAITGADTFEHKRELADEFGWRNFGDIPADHENAYSGLSEPVVSHYNNQYDAVAGFACQFFRSGDRRWHRMMNELAAHVVDIDIYHTDGDKSAYCHGLFWHTAHYVSAAKSSHRSFPKHPKVSGGGPSNEHNYTAGLRLHWLMTGDARSRDAAIGLANWVIAMDDGLRTPFRWVSRADTGLASQTYSPLFHGPGRGAGHSILALLDGHRLTREQAFLDKADALVRRCIHPADDIGALHLLDAERRWSYTVFLQVLGRYLDYRVELGCVDRPYAYGRAALLHYARWMAEHEYPYLERPEILEYPTETWAAQDMRKSEVFSYAAAHASGEERDRFLERAAFFFDASVATLLQMPTRTLTRPTVLMLTNGYRHLSPHVAAPRPTPAAAEDFGVPSVFIPQKVLVKQRLTVSAGAVVVLLAVALLALS
jgi:hypothetical protein